MRRLDDDNRVKCEGQRGESILRSISVTRNVFIYWQGRRVENLKGSLHVHGEATF
jgi:hypothetical protein